MLVFDEKKYAEEIITNKKYSTVKTQGRERCILVRHLTSLNYSHSEIKEVLSNIPMSGGEYLSDRDKPKCAILRGQFLDFRKSYTSRLDTKTTGFF